MLKFIYYYFSRTKLLVIMKFIKSFWIENFEYIIVFLIVIIAVIAANISRRVLTKHFNSTSNTLHLDPTRYRFFINLISFFIYAAAFMFTLFYVPELKSLALTLFAGAGIFAAIIGFASQQAFSNIINGIFIVISKPFSVGDWIKVSNFPLGEVEDITLRHTIIKDFENKRIIIPNAIMGSEVIINESITDARICEFVEMKIALDSDIDKAISIMQNVAENHVGTIDNRTLEEIAAGEPLVKVRMVEIGDYFLIMRAYVWANGTIDGFTLKYELIKNFRDRFIDEGIEIPVPYRKIIQ